MGMIFVNVQLNSCSVPPDQNKAPYKVDFVRVDKIMKILRKADRDKDGCYNKDELKNALKELGAIFPAWRANRCLTIADADNDGIITGDEIDTLLEYLRSCGY